MILMTSAVMPQLSRHQYERLISLLGQLKRHVSGDSTVLQTIDNAGHRYLSNLLASLQGRTRSEDRLANSEIAGTARALRTEINRLMEDDTTGTEMPLIQPLPKLSDRPAWISGICSVLLTVEHTVQLSNLEASQLALFVAKLQTLRLALASLDDDARVHLAFTLSDSSDAKSNEDDPLSLAAALDCIAEAADRARDAWRSQRGPEPLTALRLLAEDLYHAVVQIRGTPLKLLLSIDGTYTGKPENDDTLFLLEIVEWVHASVPIDLRNRLPRAEAIFDAYKEHHALMRRNEQTSRVTRKRMARP